MRKRNKKIAILIVIVMTVMNLAVPNNVFTLHAEKITTQENIKGRMASTLKKPTVTLLMKKNNKNKLILYVGDSIQLKLSGSAKWFSNKKAVATINSRGMVKAKKAGFVIITAKVKRSKYTCRITVKSKKIKQTPIPTTSVNNLMTETPVLNVTEKPIPKITVMPTTTIPVLVKTASPEPVAPISTIVPDATGKVNNGPLNVRVGAGTKYERLIYNGEYVNLPIGYTVQIKKEVIGETANWYYIEFNYNDVALKGYVMAQYVTRIEYNPTYSVSPVTTKTPSPTLKPTASPTLTPTINPTLTPTASPTFTPTASPSLKLTASPTLTPTIRPTLTPTASPTFMPIASPMIKPTASPTLTPTISPILTPTASPTLTPTASPTFMPTSSPTVKPTPTPVTINERSVVTDLKEGYYMIASSLDKNYVLEIEGALTTAGANCQIYKRNNSTGQLFYIKKNSEGYYTLTAKCSNMRVDVWLSNKNPGANICQSAAHEGDNQQWTIYKNNIKGTYQFQARSNNLYMGMSGNIISSNNNVNCNSYSNGAEQNWYLEYVGK